MHTSASYTHPPEPGGEAAPLIKWRGPLVIFEGFIDTHPPFAEPYSNPDPLANHLERD